MGFLLGILFGLSSNREHSSYSGAGSRQPKNDILEVLKESLNKDRSEFPIHKPSITGGNIIMQVHLVIKRDVVNEGREHTVGAYKDKSKADEYVKQHDTTNTGMYFVTSFNVVE